MLYMASMKLRRRQMRPGDVVEGGLPAPGQGMGE